jgi:hypothetical protein
MPMPPLQVGIVAKLVNFLFCCLWGWRRGFGGGRGIQPKEKKAKKKKKRRRKKWKMKGPLP